MPSNNSGTWKTILALKGHLPDVPHLNAGLGTIYSWKALQDHPEFYSRNDLQSPSVTRGPVPTIPAWKTVIWQFGLHQQLVFISVILTNKSSHLRWLKNIRWSPKKQVLSCGQLKSSWIWPRKKAEGSLVKRVSTFQRFECGSQSWTFYMSLEAGYYVLVLVYIIKRFLDAHTLSLLRTLQSSENRGPALSFQC